MNFRIRLLIAFTVLMIISLACSTLSGGNLQQDPPAQVLPTNTPLPPLPTITPLPPVEEPTEEPATPMTQASQILFQDDFSNPDSGWDRSDYDHGASNYMDGTYRIVVNKDSYYIWANPNQNFGDQIIEVQTTVLSPDTDNQYGIICRYLDLDNWYTLMISSDGYAAIRKHVPDTENNMVYVVDWIQSPTIYQGSSTNNLRAECIGSRLALYVNGMLAVEGYDTDIPSGDAGLIAGTFEAASIEVLFDNFQVSAP